MLMPLVANIFLMSKGIKARAVIIDEGIFFVFVFFFTLCRHQDYLSYLVTNSTPVQDIYCSLKVH